MSDHGTLALALPPAFDQRWQALLATNWTAVAINLAILTLALLVALVLVPLVLAAIARLARRTESVADDRAVKHLRSPLRWLGMGILMRAAASLTSFSDDTVEGIRHVLLIECVFAGAWLIWRGVVLAEDLVAMRFDVHQEDNLQARKIATQVRGIRNVVGFLIWVLACAVALTTFEGVRQFGVTLLASAGVAGLVIGFAAQRSISTIIAGVQIALTQPIRVDDVVVVKGEWGRIEEITLTYVVVKIWDLRRLVLPIHYFIENPFENWTRTDADILGTIYFELDYGVDLDAMRAELTRLLKASDNWNGEVNQIVVTEARERGVQVRALVSADNSSKAWDLRCEVREGLIAFVYQNYPEAFPRLRTDFTAAREAG